MNQLMLVVVAVVALCYCGGNYCPAILKKNKEMLLGVAVGMALCSFFDMKLEGVTNMNTPSFRGLNRDGGGEVSFQATPETPPRGFQDTPTPTITFRPPPLGGR